MIRKRPSNNTRRSNIPTGTATAIRLDSEDMTVMNLRTPRNFERLASAIRRHTKPNIIALGRAKGSMWEVGSRSVGERRWPAALSSGEPLD